MRRLAVLSLHTSPLAQPGQGDSGGMNVYVRELVSALAQAGVQASLGVIRSLAHTDSTTGKVTGIQPDLPCLVTGLVDGNDVSSKYSVTIKYFMVDPTGKDTNWQDAVANRMVSVNGAGIFLRNKYRCRLGQDNAEQDYR